MAATVNVPYEPGMVLGRTYDLRNLSSGIDIFSEEALKNVMRTRRDYNIIKYSVIKSSQDVNKILGISGDISLKAKAGLIDVKGMSSYFSENVWNENTVKILARAHVETVTETMKSSPPREDWNKTVVGTHYIRSITYGGDLIVSIEIGGKDSRQKEDIKAKLEGELNLMLGSTRVGASTEKLDERKKINAQVKIEYFSTTPTGVMPRDVDGMLRALDSFKEDLMKVNEMGVPFYCELVPLGFLDPDIPVVRRKSNEVQLQQLEDCYDDIRTALTKLNTFTRRHDVDLTGEDEKKVREVTGRMEKALETVNDVIYSLDVASDEHPIKSALEEYKRYSKTGGFHKEVTKLIKTLTVNEDTPKPADMVETGEAIFPSGIPLDMILVGKPAQGKTSTGNTILGSNSFSSEAASPERSEAPECFKVTEKVGDRLLTVVDIQASKPTKNPKDMYMHVFPQLIKLLLQNPEGFHAYLIVMSTEEPVTEDDVKRFTDIKKTFGDILLKYSIIVFTGEDLFMKRMLKEGKDITFDQYIQQEAGPLKGLIQDCGGRYILFNNMEKDCSVKFEQVAKLIRIVSKVVEDNHYTRYTNNYFKFSAVVNIDPNLFFYPEHPLAPGMAYAFLLSSPDPKCRALSHILRREGKQSNLQTFIRVFFPDFKEPSNEQCVIS